MAADRASSVKWEVSMGGTVDIRDCIQFTVDKDVNQPDHAIVVLKNTDHKYTPMAKDGTTLTIKTTSPGKEDLKTLFTGKVVKVDPQYKGGDVSRIAVSAYDDKLHKALQGKKSWTQQDCTYKDILEKCLPGCDIKGPDENPTFKHRYIANMSDLDLARMVAQRMGCFIFNQEGTIKVLHPKKAEDSGIEFYVYENQDKEHRMKSFNPRLTGSRILKAVEVRGWDPEKKEAIVHKAKAEPSKLGNTEASSAASSTAADSSSVCDVPVFSLEEAKMIAKAHLVHANLGYIEAEAEAFGKADYGPGQIIKIFINSQAADRFDGSYFVIGTTHKYSHGTQTNPDGGYTTVFRLKRDAEVQ